MAVLTPFDSSLNRREALRQSAIWTLGFGLWPLAAGCGCGAQTSRPPADLEKVGRINKRGADNRVLSISFIGRKPVSDGDLIGLSQFPHLQELRIQECSEVTDAGMEHVARLAKLTDLHLLHVPITDKGVSRLSSLTILKTLSLLFTRVTGSGLADLAELPLEKLEISGASSTAAGLKAVRKLTHLKDLSLHAPKLKPADLPSLLSLQNLEKL